VNKLQLQRPWIKLVRLLSTVDNTRYTRVSHSRQWSNYNISLLFHVIWYIHEAIVAATVGVIVAPSGCADRLLDATVAATCCADYRLVYTLCNATIGI